MKLETLKKILIDIPETLDKSKKKEKISQETIQQIKIRSKNICELCGNYKSKRTHHIIPNGLANEENLIDLCIHCHEAIHLLLYTSKKWKFPYKPHRHY
ncbi:MAG: HNH endonuclease [Promethearchaeota archaeon]